MVTHVDAHELNTYFQQQVIVNDRYSYLLGRRNMVKWGLPQRPGWCHTQLSHHPPATWKSALEPVGSEQSFLQPEGCHTTPSSNLGYWEQQDQSTHANTTTVRRRSRPATTSDARTSCTTTTGETQLPPFVVVVLAQLDFQTPFQYKWGSANTDKQRAKWYLARYCWVLWHAKFDWWLLVAAMQ